MKSNKILVILGSIFVLLALAYVYHINNVTVEGMFRKKKPVTRANITTAEMTDNPIYVSGDGPFQAKMTDNPLYGKNTVGGASQEALEHEYEPIGDPEHEYAEIGDDPDGEEKMLRDNNAVADYKNDLESPPNLPLRTEPIYAEADNPASGATNNLLGGGADTGEGFDIDGLPAVDPDTWSLAV